MCMAAEEIISQPLETIHSLHWPPLIVLIGCCGKKTHLWLKLLHYVDKHSLFTAPCCCNPERDSEYSSLNTKTLAPPTTTPSRPFPPLQQPASIDFHSPQNHPDLFSPVLHTIYIIPASFYLSTYSHFPTIFYDNHVFLLFHFLILCHSPAKSNNSGGIFPLPFTTPSLLEAVCFLFSHPPSLLTYSQISFNGCTCNIYMYSLFLSVSLPFVLELIQYSLFYSVIKFLLLFYFFHYPSLCLYSLIFSHRKAYDILKMDQMMLNCMRLPNQDYPHERCHEQLILIIYDQWVIIIVLIACQDNDSAATDFTSHFFQNSGLSTPNPKLRQWAHSALLGIKGPLWAPLYLTRQCVHVAFVFGLVRGLILNENEGCVQCLAKNFWWSNF
ncbi:hypothetical protein VP01_492g1 [Puccinia sorghi]|uniref:Uncharacterized protein n=1 Tax=Puccinia sorghi TaxID=27349 RepID=A0A0L6UM25_9BASI|nr:hypothetical protein VP01_492g1 [Puccinia sorghi]